MTRFVPFVAMEHEILIDQTFRKDIVMAGVLEDTCCQL